MKNNCEHAQYLQVDMDLHTHTCISIYISLKISHLHQFKSFLNTLCVYYLLKFQSLCIKINLILPTTKKPAKAEFFKHKKYTQLLSINDHQIQTNG